MVLDPVSFWFGNCVSNVVLNSKRSWIGGWASGEKPVSPWFGIWVPNVALNSIESWFGKEDVWYETP